MKPSTELELFARPVESSFKKALRFIRSMSFAEHEALCAEESEKLQIEIETASREGRDLVL